MTYTKLAANVLGLRNQDNTSGKCTADIEQIIIQLANNAVSEITETMTCSKSVTNAPESCKEIDNTGA